MVWPRLLVRHHRWVLLPAPHHQFQTRSSPHCFRLQTHQETMPNAPLLLARAKNKLQVRRSVNGTISNTQKTRKKISISIEAKLRTTKWSASRPNSCPMRMPLPIWNSVTMRTKRMTLWRVLKRSAVSLATCGAPSLEVISQSKICSLPWTGLNNCSPRKTLPLRSPTKFASPSPRVWLAKSLALLSQPIPPCVMQWSALSPKFSLPTVTLTF
mmetsp:Transcript_6317/g.23807  ORF Transcript_6317/g.23807 Transcript_6317/m.23807 type:complete len:213 (-) Transcript_6317:2864-3502(-)